jgi:hypothetical protein
LLQRANRGSVAPRGEAKSVRPDQSASFEQTKLKKTPHSAACRPVRNLGLDFAAERLFKAAKR